MVKSHSLAVLRCNVGPISYVFFETAEYHCRRHQPRRYHNRCAQAAQQEVVPIPASSKTVWLDERCTSCTSYEWLGWVDHERNADIDILEQVHCHTLQHNQAMLIVADTSTILPEPSWASSTALKVSAVSSLSSSCGGSSRRSAGSIPSSSVQSSLYWAFSCRLSQTDWSCLLLLVPSSVWVSALSTRLLRCWSRSSLTRHIAHNYRRSLTLFTTSAQPLLLGFAWVR